MINFRKMVRSAQVYFPGLQDYRFSFQRNIRTLLRQTYETDFEILSKFPTAEGSNLYVDIGANRGESIQSILMKKPEAKVVAFEPNAYLTEKLHRLYDQDSRVEIFNCGIGSEEGTLTLFVPFYNNYMFDGLASFREEIARDWLRTRLYGFQPEKLDIRKVTCPVKSLDSFSLNPFFIKIDTQGFEYEVLLGAKRTLEQSRPILLIETPQSKEKEFLSKLEYGEFYYDRHKLVSGHGCDAVNTFFIAKEKVSSLRHSISVGQFESSSH